jgi:hypothetical protein
MLNAMVIIGTAQTILHNHMLEAMMPTSID